MKILNQVTVLACSLVVAAGSYAATDKKENLSLSHNKVNFKSKVGAAAPAATVVFVEVNTKSKVYYVVESATPLIKSTSVNSTGKATAQIILAPERAAKLPVGQNTGTVTVKACKTQNCSAQYPGSPAKITVKYKVVEKKSSSSSSSNSSSSSSSSSAPVLACTNSPGDVFFDEVCSPWRDVSSYEQNYADYTNAYETTDGNNAGAARFNIIQSGDAGHNQVLDIQYHDAPEFFGAVRIRVPESESNALDMSEYANGKIVFDLKVISNSYANSPLEFNLDCSWPCTSTPALIRTDVLNEWKTYEFSVAELIERGLDIQRVSMGFMLLPTWGQQGGAHYQVDNVRWVAGDAPVNPETICYSNFFDQPWNAGVSGVGVSIIGGSSEIPVDQYMNLTQGVIPWVKAYPDWSVMNHNWLYAISDVMSYQTGELLDPYTLSNCSGAGTLSLEIYTPAALVADGNLTFSLMFVKNDLFLIDIPNSTFSVVDMKPDDWNKVSVPLSAATAGADLKFVGLRINANQVSPLLQAGFNIDNILIKHAAQ